MEWQENVKILILRNGTLIYLWERNVRIPICSEWIVQSAWNGMYADVRNYLKQTLFIFLQPVHINFVNKRCLDSENFVQV